MPQLKIISSTFVQIPYRLRDCMVKYGRPGQVTDENMAHAHCMPDNKDYKHTFTICNTHCFSTARMVTRTLLDVMLYVHRLSCCISGLKC